MTRRLDSIMSRMNIDLTPKVKVETVVEDEKNVFSLIQQEQYVGEMVKLVFDQATVQINDSFRQKVGGIPAQCFLIASRLTDGSVSLDYSHEDCCAILLRVLDSAQLNGDNDKERILIQNAQENTGEYSHWDENIQDAPTKQLMSFGGLKCRVVGTFYMDDSSGKPKLAFGNDLSNFYPNRGLKIYKPTGDALKCIVNFGINKKTSVNMGKIRYSSTNRRGQGIDDVAVIINPTDLMGQKSAVFGMTRTGKSNTVKMIAKSIYQLRQKTGQHIGQLILDPNGEYANENLQDVNDKTGKAQALRNVWQVPVDGILGREDDIVTYGLMPNANDPTRVVMKINFFDDKLLQTGKELIDDKLAADPINNVQYIKSFLGVYFQPLEGLEFAEATREKRRRLVYKTLLYAAGFKDPDGGKAKPMDKLFSEKLLKALEEGIYDFDELPETKQRDLKKAKDKYYDCALALRKFGKEGATYAELVRAFETLSAFIEDEYSMWHSFDRSYSSSSDDLGQSWLDVYLSSLLKMFQYSNAFKKIERASVYHDPKSSKKDYAHMIYDDLCQGKLVIIDQALGDSELNKLAAERIIRVIFDKNNLVFSQAQKPVDILIYVEEAHNLMPKGSEEDTTNIWARVAKEGAKFNIGMIYSTQEVSSIQKNILKNTTNWFISHLNNKEEIRALSDYYDFEDFGRSILQAEDKGFIRMKTKSNRFVVPIQVDKFQVDVQE
jgi:DNA helicase HerA-like ATPase